MPRLDVFGRKSPVFVTISLIFTFQGASCGLVVSPVGSDRVHSIVGSNVTLAVSFSGARDPAVAWFMGKLPVVTWTINSSSLPEVAESMRNVVRLELSGSLTLVNVMLNYAGNYTIEMTKPGLSKAVTSFTLNIFDRPPGNLTCFVQSVNSSLQYHCQWPGGTPQALLSFPALSNTSSGVGRFNLTVTASNTTTVTCIAHHPAEEKKCSVTATVQSTVDSESKVSVAMSCVSEASPQAVVSWSKGGEELTGGTDDLISSESMQLHIRDFNVSNLLRHNYTCTCFNPLGSQKREIHLQGPSISRSTLIRSKDGTSVTLTWATPPTSVVTAFDIQMMEPDLRNTSRSRGGSSGYRTVRREPGAVRSASISTLDPHLTYYFPVSPKGQTTVGAPSTDSKIGPRMASAAIAGLAAGIPCSFLFLLLLAGLLYLCVRCRSRRTGRQTRYPVSRAVEKAITTRSDMRPSHLLVTGDLKSPPDYNGMQQTPSERSVALPTFVPPPPVRVATTV